MATYPPKPYNLIDFRVIENTVGAADFVVAKSQLTLSATNPMVINVNDILPNGFIRTVYAAGTPQITTIDTTAATIVVGVAQKMYLKRLDTNTVQTIQVVPATASVVDLKVLFINAIQALGLTTYTAVSTGANTMTITEVGNIGGFITTMSDSGITVVVGTPHVNSSGTLTEVQQYLSTAAGTQYCKYQFIAKPTIPEGGGQATVLRSGQYILWVESADAQWAAGDAVLVSIMDGTYITNAATTQPFLEKI